MLSPFSARLLRHLPIVAALLALPIFAHGQTTSLVFSPTDAIFSNPERGFYTHRSVQAEGTPLALHDLQSLRGDVNVTLILRLYYLKSFRDQPLSQAQLDLIQTDFDRMREAGVKAVLRFAYSSSQNEPDAPLDVITGHLDQLEPLLRANSDVIAAVEAGLIGAWGEWYYSSNGLNNTQDRRAVLQKWMEVLPEDRMVQVRTPGYKRAIFSRNTALTLDEAYSGSDIARTGHHNDCFLASSTDFGTYQNIAADKAYLEQDTRFTTMGGETCNPNPPRSECETALEEMERFHWSYINKDYHSGVLGSWYRGGCMDEVKRRLGYRFELVGGTLTTSLRPGGVLTLGLDVANRGFAMPYNPRNVEVILRERESGQRYAAELPTDPRYWTAGDTTSFAAQVGVPSDLPEGTYDVLLNLPGPEPSLRDRSAYAIRLANAGVWESSTGFNDLGADAEVSASAGGADYTGSRWLQPYEDFTTSAAPTTALPTAPLTLDAAAPNPFRHATRLTLAVAQTQRVQVTAYDMLGRRVATLHDGVVFARSTQQITFRANELPTGVYFVRAVTSGSSAMQKVIVAR